MIKRYTNPRLLYFYFTFVSKKHCLNISFNFLLKHNSIVQPTTVSPLCLLPWSKCCIWLCWSFPITEPFIHQLWLIWGRVALSYLRICLSLSNY